MSKTLSLLLVLVLHSLLALAQHVITGKVYDQSGQPAPFVTVRITGSKAGTSADANGAFSIHANKGDRLLISGAGFQETEFLVQDATAINIQITRKDASMTEVVV